MSSSKNASPSSVADVILQGQGKRVDCEIQFKLLIKAKNNEITAKHPTLEGVLLGRDPIPFEPIPNIVNNDDVIERTEVSGLIMHRVKEKAERTRAIVTVKATILGWFHHSLEDYIKSSANPTRMEDWDRGNWPGIMEHIKRWYLEPVKQSATETITINEREAIMREYRSTFMKPNQTISEFETEYRNLIEIVNNPELADARKSEVEQAKDFTDKLLPATFGEWKTEVREEEDRQQQRVSCSQPREEIKGYPQSMAEAVNRAKTVERQVLMKRSRNNQHSGRRKEDRKPNMELNNFTNTTASQEGGKRLSIQEIWALPENAKASEHGFTECRYCKSVNQDSDHIFLRCTRNPRNKKKAPRTGNQRNLITPTEVSKSDNMSTEEIMAKVKMAYDMGRGAREENDKSNRQELMNFLKTCDDSNDNEESTEYRRCVKMFRNMKTTVQPTHSARSTGRITQVILDTGSSGNDMPARIVTEIGCRTIDNPFKHIPINTVLGQYHCNTIAIVPILEEVSMSPNSDFIILSFDVVQCNKKIRKEIKLNAEGSAILWVKLTFPDLNDLEIVFEFVGRTLIADATQLVHELIKMNRKIKSESEGERSSLTAYFDRMISTHLRTYPQDKQMMLRDPEIIKIRYFERYPDIADQGVTQVRMAKPKVTTGPFSPDSKLGSAIPPFSTSIKKTPISPYRYKDKVIEVDLTNMTESRLSVGGREETAMKIGITDLKDKGETMKIHTSDFPIFSYWIREKEIREHMEKTLRMAISAAKASRNQEQVDQLMMMGSKWKSHPNMASWHAPDEEVLEHECFHLKVNPNDYHPDGHDTLEFDLGARLTVELYYAYQNAVRRGGPEERNEYRRLYQAWHPQSYEFRHFRALGFAQKENNECQITIREEEYEETNERDTILYDNVEETINIELMSSHDRTFWRALRAEQEQMEDNTEFDEDFVADTPPQTYFTKDAIENAIQVREMQAKLGMFSLRKIAEAKIGGAITNKEGWSRAQILATDKILGTNVAYKMGVHTAKKQFRGSQEEHEENKVVLEADIIFDENLIMLMCVAIPTAWTSIIQIKDKAQETLIQALRKVIATLKIMGKTVSLIRVDGDKGIVNEKTKEELLIKEQVIIDASGKGSHVIETLDRKVRTIKDHVRAIRSSVQFAVGGIMLLALFLQMVNITNIMTTSGNTNSLSPFQAMLGRNARMDDICPHKPLETVLVSKNNDITNKTGNKNMIEAIFLYASNIHVANKQKTEFTFLTIDTLEKITRGAGDKLQADQTHVDKINRLANAPNSLLFCPSFQKIKAKRKQGRPKKTTQIPNVDQRPELFTRRENDYEGMAKHYEEIILATPRKEREEETQSPSLGELLQNAPILDRKRIREIGPHVDKNTFMEDIAASFMNKRATKINHLTTVENDGGVRYQFFHKADGKFTSDQPIYTACIEYQHLKDGNEFFSFAAHTSIKKALQLYPQIALDSITAEIDGMLTRKVWKGVMYGSLSEKQKKSVLFSSTIVKEKYDLDGNFVTMKSRIVTGGDGQNIEDIPERLRSAPTTATSSVATIASIAASRNMEIATVDIKQAYLNAEMESDVFMWIPQPIADILCDRDPSFQPFMHENGRVLVKLLKAQYGCVESAKLWYNHISKVITDFGFMVNPFDQCVFQKQVGEKWTYITLYVDDLMIVGDEKESVDETIDYLRKIYIDITVKRGKVHDYLGIRFDFRNEGEVFMSMSKYINEIVKGAGITGTADTPAAADLFEIDEESPRLTNQKREQFHKIVAQCLYAVTRTRPDASLPVIFLTTRVLEPTEQDEKKLERVLRYFNATLELGIFLGISENDEFRLTCFADASHGVHFNGKSHSGIIISHGRGAILAKSMKQKIVCRSSTESELVTLSDATSLAAYELQFIESLGVKMGQAQMYQDNTSTIQMAKNGKSCSDRTKHIKLRYFFIKQYIDSGEFSIIYCPTERMTADILTKPLQGKLFRDLRDKLLGYR